MRRLAKAIVASVLLAYVSGFVMYYDFSVFANWAYAFRELGLHGVYMADNIFGRDFRVVYPPLAPTIFLAGYEVAKDVAHVVGDKFVSIFLERLVVKLPLIIVHILVWYVAGYVIGWRRAYSLVLLAPPLLLVLATYNFDTVMVLLLFASVVMIRYAKAYTSGILLGLSILSKQTAALALPFLAYEAWRKRKLVNFMLGVLTALAVALPFSLMEPHYFLENIAGFHAARMPQGPTIWYSLLALKGYSDDVFTAFWLPLFLIVYMFTLLYTVAKRVPLEASIAAAMLSYLAIGKVVNPVYMVWPYLFLLTCLGSTRGKKLLALYYAAFVFVLTHFGLKFFGAVAAWQPVFLPEEKRWLSPQEVLTDIRESLAPYPTLQAITETVLLKNNPLKAILAAAYLNWPLTSLVLSTAYTLIVVTLLWLVLSDNRTRFLASHQT